MSLPKTERAATHSPPFGQNIELGVLNFQFVKFAVTVPLANIMGCTHAMVAVASIRGRAAALSPGCVRARDIVR